MDRVYQRLHMGIGAREKVLAWGLVVPTLLIVFATALGPLIYAGWLSFHDVSVRLAAREFIGIDNYVDIVKSPIFRASVLRTAYFSVVSLAIQIPLGIAMALVLNQKFVGRNIVRAVILIPWAIPTIVNGVLWQWIYNGSYGALNGLLYQFGLIEKPIAWLGMPWRAMNMVILADTWKVLPFYVVLFLAGLQTIPTELYDAAAVDGAGNIAKFRHVILPYLRPLLLVVLIVRTMETFRVFDIVYMLTLGGPAGGTMVIAFHTYQVTFLSLKFGYGTALSFLIALIVLLLALVYIRILRTEDSY